MNGTVLVLDGDVPRRASCGVSMSRLVGFAGGSSGLNDFGCRSWALAARLLGRGCCYFKLRKAFSRFCRGRGALLEGCGVGLRALLQRGVSGPVFCGDLEYGFGKVVGRSDFSEQFGGLIDRYGRVGCGLGVVRRAAWLVVGPVVVGGCASLFGCTTAVRASDSVAASSWNFSQGVGAWRCVFDLARRGSAVDFYLLWHAVELAIGTRLCLL